MYGDLSSKYQVASSTRSAARRSSTFHASTGVPSTSTVALPSTLKIRPSARLMAGLHTGAVITTPSFRPTASGTKSDAPAKNPGASDLVPLAVGLKEGVVITASG